MSVEIRNLNDLIIPTLKSGEKIISYETKRLLPPGENYGSIMVQVKVNILNVKGEERTVHYVAKTCPPPGIIWEIFQTKVTFKKEVGIYVDIIPTLNKFGEKLGINNLMNFFAESINARISLDPSSDVVDEDAVLLLENLKAQGYNNGDRFIGFDIKSSKLLLSDLAIMHAVPIAYSAANPIEFKSRILPHLLRDYSFTFTDDQIEGITKTVINEVSNNPKCLPYLSKIEEEMRNITSTLNTPLKTNEIFTTLTHNDFWTNNVLIKFENGEHVSNKFVDFQLIEYSSLAHDILFFLYTSVELSVLENHFDELLEFYYDKFIESLMKLKYDVSDYNFDALKKDLAIAAKKEFVHLLFIVIPILTLKGEVAELSDMVTASDIIKSTNKLHENCGRRLQLLLLDFVKRGWI